MVEVVDVALLTMCVSECNEAVVGGANWAEVDMRLG